MVGTTCARISSTQAHLDLNAKLAATLLCFGNYTVYRHWLLNDPNSDLVTLTRSVVEMVRERFPEVS